MAMRSRRENIGYFTKTVSDKLQITLSKLRRLTQALEKQGYTFTRNKSNQRIYFGSDIQTLQQMITKIRKGRTVEAAAGEVLSQNSDMPQTTTEENPSVFEWDEPEITGSGISLSASQFRLMVEQVAATAAEKTAEEVVRKYDHEMERRIELRDRELMTRLREMSEAGRKKKGWLSRVIRH